MESGEHTDNRIGSAEFTLPPRTSGPPAHWHEMHDETFLVTQGKMQFHGLHGNTIVANLGDYVTVPTRSPHTFSNPYDEEAKFFNTYTPAFYINYFKMLSQMATAVSGIFVLFFYSYGFFGFGVWGGGDGGR